MRQLYDKWHDHPYHPHIHWAIFVGLSLALSFSIINAINITYLGVPEVASAQTSGLVAGYSFNEGTGTTAGDSSGNNNNGTLTNGPTWTAGKYGSALQFDASDDGNDTNNPQVNLGTSFDIATNTFTISAWVNPTNYDDWRTIIGKRNSGATPRFHWFLNIGDGSVVIYSSDTTLYFAYAVPTGAWTHLTLVASAMSTSLYVNGVLQETLEGFTLGTCSAACYAAIGDNGEVLSGGSDSDPFKGKIDELRVYNRSLSQAEIQTDMNTPIGGAPPADTTAPTISGVSASSITQNSATISWTTNEPADSQVEYGLTTSYGNQTTLNTSLVTAHSQSLTGLSPSTLYHYRVKSKDASGNLATSGDFTFTTIASDTTAPSIPSSLSATAISSSQINLSWNVSTDNVGVTGYRIYRSGTQIATVTSGTAYNNTGLSPSTSYSYTVAAYDAAGNVSSQSSAASATTQAAAGTLSVSLSASPSSGTAPVNGVDLTATVGGTQTGPINYTFYCNRSDTGTNITTPYDFKFDASTLNPYTTLDLCSYQNSGTYTAKVIVERGTLVAEARTTITVSSATDTTAPSTPTNLSATTISSSQINLSWTASTDNVGVTGYRIYRSGTQIATVTSGTSYSNTGLTANTTYSYTVAAYDAAGNVSAQSTSASATTQAAATYPWAGIISPSRAVDWSTAGVQGGIPNRTTICATLNPGATTAQINTAIANCPAGQVVFLNAGTYNNLTGVVFNGKSNVTLRGAGPDKTILNFTNSDSCTGYGGAICIEGASIWPPGGVGTVYNWTGATTWPKGTTQITLNSVTGLSVGTIMTFDQLNDNPSSLSGTAGALVCDTVGVCSQEGSDGRRANRGQSQTVQITAINGNTITFTPGLYMPNWRSSQSPQAWAWPSPTVTMDGVEDLTVNSTNNSASNGNITITNAYNIWVKNVRSILAPNFHVWAYVAYRVEVRDSYFFRTKASQSTSYGWSAYSAGGDHLVINNIFQQINSPVLENGDTGSVIAYNFVLNDGINDNWVRQAYTAHNLHVGMELFEGNIGNSFRADTFHGTSDFITLFRNHFSGAGYGTDGSGTSVKSDNLIPVNLMAGGRYMNALGNVLGTAGQHTFYQSPLTIDDPNYNSTVYVNGFTYAATGAGFGSPDPYVNSTLMRWGNYDTANASNRFQASEVPTGLSDYPNAVPSSQSLPASFFLNAKPSWFGSLPWPLIGPDVTGGNIANAGGRAYKNPAQLCYELMTGPADGSGGVLTFNADNCYGTGTPSPDTQAPSVPTNLSASAISSSQINLSWTASTDNVGVTGYRVERCTGSTCTTFTQVGTPTANSYSDTGLTAATTYRYRVRATDAAGNLSGYSSIVNGTTQSVTPPPSTKFQLNDRVQVVLGNLNVRATPSTSGTLLGSQPVGALGTIIGGPTAADGYNWWNVNYDTAPDGWSVEDNLAKVSSPTITIGETNILTSDDSGNGNLLLVQQATLSQTATLQSLSFYVTTASGKLRLGLYDATGPGGGPGQKKAEIAEFTPVAGWSTANVITPVSLTAGTYWLAHLPESSSLGFKLGSTGSFKYYSYIYGPMPATFSTSPISGTGHWSFYATLSTVPDTVAPIISGVSASSITQNSAMISWTTNELSTHQVEYGLTTGYGSQTVENTTLMTAHSQALSGLLVSTLYHYRVKSKDASGNLATSGDFTFTTTAIDTTPPSIPTGLTATAISSSQINLSWTASTDNVGVTGYRIYRSGTQIATSTSNTYSDTGLTASTLYSYTVAAYDAAGNISPQSSAASATTQASAPSGQIIDPSRRIDWSLAGVTGGIPNRTTICSTLNPGATASQINSAIQNCPANQVVYLNAGNYNLTSGITMKSNVTLRGAGANQTKLNFSGFTSGVGGGGSYAIGVEGYYDAQWWDQVPGPSGSNPANIETWIGTNGQNGVYTKGATVLNLGSQPTGSPNLQVGDMLFLFQNDDSAPTNGFFVCSNMSAGCSREGSGYTRGTGQRQAVKVTAINGTQITITPGIYLNNYRTSQNPRVHWWGNDMRGAGIEDLYIEAGSASHYTNVSFFEASDSWIKGVVSHETGSRNHILVNLSRNITVQDSYLNDGCSGGCGGSSTGYGVELFAATAALVQNNILVNVESPFLFSTGSEGNVIAYNYEIGGATHIQSHEVGFLMNLIEGNDSGNVRADTYHGNQNFTTIFRNRLRMRGEANVDLWSYNRYFNIIGNVLGTSNANRYECVAPDPSGQCWRYASPSVIYRLGYAGDSVSAQAGVSNDPLVATTLLRWGNYDTVTNSIRWLSSEVPSALSQYANPVPSTQSLPASYYLSSKPSWFGSIPWPAIGPDITGGDISGVGGHAYKVPAQVCYESLTGGISGFNASICYAGAVPPPTDTTPPSIPTNLSATAVSSSQINLTWTASTDNVGVTGYRVYRGGTQISQVTSGTSYSNTGLSPSTSYSYTVSAYDAAGNVSGQSTSASATTQPLTSTKFSINDRIQVFTGDGSNLNVRQTANGTLLGQQPDGALGTVIGGPTSAGSFTWWNINFDSGVDGWAAEDYLIAYTAPPPTGQIIDPSRRIDWSSTNPGVEGGIPNRTTICATLNPGATVSQINSAIASCPSGQVVKLNAGTYNLSAMIDFGGHSNVTLRGAGPDQTQLVFSAVGPNGCGTSVWPAVCIKGNDGWAGGTLNSTTWISGYTQGTKAITVGSTAGLSVGMTIALDQLNDTADTGGIWVNDTFGKGSIEGTCLARPGRCQVQLVRVTGISGNTISITPGIYATNWRAGQSPQVWWTGTMITGVGVEDITLNYAAVSPSNPTDTRGILFHNATNGWVKNIRSIQSGRNHVDTDIAAHIEVRDSFFYGTKNLTGGSQSYGVELSLGSDNLIVNNIFHKITSPVMMGNAAATVALYNYGIDMLGNPPTWTASSWMGNHDAGGHMHLFEGNDGNQVLWDTFHGAGGNTATLFRNYLSGWESGRTGGTIPVAIWANNRAQNIVGNVLGTPGYHNTYEGSCSTCLYMLGDAAWAGSTYQGVSFDPMVKSSLLRWGNYDVVSGATRWNASEVPTTGITYINGNPVPTTQTLPSSFFFANQPSWWSTPWGTPSWPAIGPDVSDGNLSGLGGHVYKIPARLCYENTSQTNGILNFNANNCYGSTIPPPPDTTPPSIPTNLSATTISSSQISLSWTASTDNVGVTGYRVERCTGSACANFVQVATPTGTSYNDTGLSASTAYRYRVRAQDAAGNLSGYSTIINATTPAAGTGILYYVATTGNDTNPGTQALPWRTIAKAAQVMVGGDTTIVTAGTYNETVSSVRSGSASARIPFRASGAAVTNTFRVSHDYITIDGFEITAGDRNDIDGDNNQILNNTFHDSNDGGFGVIQFRGSYNLLKGNRFYASTGPGTDAPQVIFEAGSTNNTAENNELGPLVDADAFRVWGTGHVIRGNYIHDITTGGNAHTDVIQTFGLNCAEPCQSQVLFEKNRIIQSLPTQGNLQMFMSSCSNRCGSPNLWDWTVRNNIYVNVIGQAILGIPNIKFYNNTIYESGTGNNLVLAIRCGTGTHEATNARVQNNIIITPSSVSDYGSTVSIENCSDTVHSYNHVTRLPGHTTLTSVPSGANNINGGDPGFVDVSANNFHLQSTSPNIGAAVTLSGFSDDYDGVTRSVPWDMGAFEGGSTPPPPDITAPSVPSGLSATPISSSQINLSWTASTDNVGVTGYRIYRGGTQIGTVTSGTTYSDTGLAASTAYSYTISAYDAAGNASAQSTSVSATTQAVTPPPSTKFTINDRIQIFTGDGSNLNVRQTPNGTLLGQQPDGLLGTVIGGPTSSGGFNWWNINFDSGVDGWAAEDYLIAYTAPPPSGAPWSGIIDPARATDWREAGATIVSRTTQCGATIAAYTGTAATINTAIANCPAGQFVQLGAGTFTLSSGITIAKNDVTLRGMGASLTKLKINGLASSCGFFYLPSFSVCSPTSSGHSGTTNGGGPGPDNSTTWTSGYAQGTTVITLGAYTNLTVGAMISLDQINDASDGFPATGDVYVCDGAQPCSWEGGGSFYRLNRAQLEQHKVIACGTSTSGAACTSNTVTLDSPIMTPNFRASQSPGAWWGNPGVTIENVGVENLAIDFTDVEAPPYGEVGIIVTNAMNSWFKGISLINNGSSGSFLMHFLPINALRLTLRDSYIYGSAGPAANTNYAIASMNVSRVLYENNILHHNIGSLVSDDPETGSVYGYNYINDAFYTGGAQPHNSGDLTNLWEGNNFGTFFVDAIHGTHFFYTLFRNHIDGRANSPTSPAEAGAGVVLASHSRFFNLIGNVIGYSGFTNYSTVMATSRDDSRIYQFGFMGNHSGTFLGNDPNVSRTVMLWGNWDNVNNASRFLASEVPSGIANYANPVPASQTLPASFYLSSRPSWWTTPWGTPKWPAIGPDVIGGNVTNSPTGGHADKIPARLCFENTIVDPAYPLSSPRIKLFDASTCYTSVTPDTQAPSIPTGLTASAISSSQINLSWTASTDNVGVTGYRIYRGGTQIGTVTSGTTYSDTGLAASTAYSYTISAYDAAGNVSGQSSPVSVTTNLPTSTKFNINDRVEVANGPVNVRSSASLSGTLLGAQVDGSLGTVIGGPTYADGFFWWNVNFDSAPDGWSVEDYLINYTAPVTYTLTVQKTGTGAGTVSGGAINCGSTCSATLTSGAALTLSATAGTNSAFTSWVVSPASAISSGCATSLTCTVAVTGNTTVTATFTSTADTIAPIVSLTAPANGATVSDTSVMVSATASDNVGVVGVQFKLDGVNLANEDIVSPYTITWDTTTATNASHVLTATARDAAGNQTTSSAVAVTVSNVSPAPTVTLSATPTSITSGSASTLTWSSTNATSCTASGGWTGAKAISGTQSVSPTVTTTYTLACTGTGGTATQSVTVTVTAAPDTTPPSIPTNLSASNITQTSVALSWTASTDNVGVTGYRIYRGGTQIGTVTSGTTYSDTGLAASTAYSYTISAYDAAGNVSGQSSPVSVTTNLPTSTKFNINDRVEVANGPVNVRSSASLSGTLLGAQVDGSLGTVIGGPTYADNYFWWNINYDNAPDGWSVEDFLEIYSAPIVGDFNGDGLVNSIDFSLMTSAWNTNNSTYDLNRDGIVNSLDYVIMVQNWSL